MKFIKKIIFLICTTTILQSLNTLYAHDNFDLYKTNLKALCEIVQKISNADTKFITPNSSSNTKAPTLQQFFMLAGYVEPILEIMKAYHESGKEEPCIICKSCKKGFIATIFFGILLAKAMKDFREGKDNFDQMKKLLDESIEIVNKGVKEDIENFMQKVSDELDITCEHCTDILK